MVTLRLVVVSFCFLLFYLECNVYVKGFYFDFSEETK